MQTNEAKLFVCDIITLEVFQDLKGEMKHLWRSLGDLGPVVQAFVDSEKLLDKHGELIDSDADEHGNLRCSFFPNILCIGFSLFYLVHCI